MDGMTMGAKAQQLQTAVSYVCAASRSDRLVGLQLNTYLVFTRLYGTTLNAGEEAACIRHFYEIFAGTTTLSITVHHSNDSRDRY